MAVSDNFSRLSAALLCSLFILPSTIAAPTVKQPCDSVDKGFQCSPEMSHLWAHQGAWFSVPSDVSVTPPAGCSVTFASVLSRHGSRDPTLKKTQAYAELITKIQDTSTKYPDEFAFLKDYNYTLGADQLTDMGKQEMVNSGAHFFRRYSKLATGKQQFVRTSGLKRVVDSANEWLKGYAKEAKQKTPESIDLTVSSGAGNNNTLVHTICTKFQKNLRVRKHPEDDWAAVFVPPIQERINSKLGTQLNIDYVLRIMDMCSFDTLASPTSEISPFCTLFTTEEWQKYDYYHTIRTYYGYGSGSDLGPTQGVGYVNELLARLTNKKVDDNTSTNRTQSANPKTFPLDNKIYADFSHDNNMLGIYAALGLFNTTKPFSTKTFHNSTDLDEFSASRAVPYAARMYVEKLKCSQQTEEYVRIIVNDRVMPLEFCQADKDRKCTLSNFVKSQSFARGGGHWDKCFAA